MIDDIPERIWKVDSDEASRIIDTRKPLGLYMHIEDAGEKYIYVGIDNSTGDAWTEDFDNEEDCIGWLRREIDI